MIKKNNIKLKQLLTLVFTGLATIPLIIAGILIALFLYDSQKNQVFHHEKIVCNNIATNLEFFFQRLEYQLQMINQYKNFNSLQEPVQRAIFSELLTKHSIFQELTLFTPQGKVLFFVSDTGTQSEHIPEGFLSSTLGSRQRGGPVSTLQYSEVQFDKETGEPFILVALPLLDLQTGEILSIIVAKAKIKTIWHILANLPHGQEEDIFILDNKNRIIAHKNPSIVLRETFFFPPDNTAISKGLSQKKSIVTNTRVQFNNLHLTVVKEISTAQAFKPITNTLKVLFIITLSSVLLAFILILVSARVVIAPIEALTNTVRAIQNGDFFARASVPNQFEIGELATSFNEMTNRLQETLHELESEINERKTQQQILEKSERYNRMLFEENPLGLALCKMDGTLVDINPAYASLMGRTIDETKLLSYWDITPEKYLPQEQKQLKELERTGRYGPYEKKYIHKDGHLVPVVLTGLLIEQDGERYIWSVVENISVRKKAEQKLRLAGKAIESSLEGIVITNADLVIAEVNDAYCNITGYSREEILGKTPNHTRSGYHNLEFYQDMWQSITTTGKWQGEIWDRRKNGEIFPKWLSISSLKDQDNQITHYVGVFSDITDIKQTEEELRQLAHYDALTGLANRTLFNTLLAKNIDMAARQQHLFAVVFLDLDRFKQINDSLGHQAGDELLITVGGRIEECVRTSDTVSRLGGDEFTIILSEYQGEFNPEIICQRVLEVVSQPVVIEEHTVFVSASIGIAVYPKDGDTVVELTRNADTAMYQAKKKGKNRYQFYDELMNASAMERLDLESKLREGIADGQLCLYYQPKLDIQNGRVSGCEALVRWLNPEWGLISPEKLIPLAE